jgi:hypothetical protein
LGQAVLQLHAYGLKRISIVAAGSHRESRFNAQARIGIAAEVVTFGREELTMMKTTLIVPSVIALVTMVLWAPVSEAYPTYSDYKVQGARGVEEAVGNCKTCHGHFRATNAEDEDPWLQDEYISPTDGKRWSEVYTSVEPGSEPEAEIGLHDIHRHIMVDEDNPRGSPGPSGCDVCHGDDRYPVPLNASKTDWFGPNGGIGCMGCHGRMQDANDVDVSQGLGAGLRQHHTNAGVTECKSCHADADPANFTPVGENVRPLFYRMPYYPDDEFVNKPTNPCNWRGRENYAGGGRGLDNDGDGKYDQGDEDCKRLGTRRW